MLLEIAAFNLQDAINAANAGADRIELCSNYKEGGVTSSYEILALARQQISIPIFSIIRPRAGDFVYNEQEFEQMKKDILFCKQLGCNGIVLGVLNDDKTIDINRTKALVELAKPLPVTFHRAFDEVANSLQALENIIDCGCKRILTSGKKTTAIAGKELLKQLVKKANGKIIIMIGGGVRSNHIAELKEYTKATEFHSAAITKNNYLLDTNEVKQLVTILKGN